MPYVNKADAHAINRKYEELKNDYYKIISEYDDEPDISFFEGTAFSSEYLFNDLNDLADKIKNRLESIHYETDKPKEDFIAKENELRSMAEDIQDRFHQTVERIRIGADGLWESEEETIRNMNIWKGL